MKASIIITTRNRAGLLSQRSLPSAINQTSADYEIIVVDDNSEDYTEESVVLITSMVIKRDFIRYIKYDSGRNLSKLRNKGIKEARGEYVVCLDDDDELVPQFLEWTIPLLDTHPEYQGVSGGRTTIYPEGSVYDPPRDFEKPYASIDDGFLLRKSIFDKIQYDENLPTDEDADFGIQFIRSGFKMAYLGAPLLKKYGHSVRQSGSFSHPTEWRLNGLKKYIEKNEEYFIEHKSKDDLEYFWRYAGRTFCWGGWMKEGRHYLRLARGVRFTPRITLYLIMSYGGKKVFGFYYWLETFIIRKMRICKQKIKSA